MIVATLDELASSVHLAVLDGHIEVVAMSQGPGR